jgi:TPR repeat protein
VYRFAIARFYAKKQQEEKAFAWFSAAAQHGHGLAMLELASHYQAGSMGAQQDDDQARRW